MLTWIPNAKAKDYYGRAQAGNGDMLYCHSTNPSCVITGLRCGTVYNFSAQASDGTCNSSFSDPEQIGAGINGACYSSNPPLTHITLTNASRLPISPLSSRYR